jgi:hypothetical protein
MGSDQRQPLFQRITPANPDGIKPVDRALAGGSFGDQIIRLPAIARAPLSRVGDVQAVLTPADEVIFH